jgi:hypothetical protein
MELLCQLIEHDGMQTLDLRARMLSYALGNCSTRWSCYIAELSGASSAHA